MIRTQCHGPLLSFHCDFCGMTEAIAGPDVIVDSRQREFVQRHLRCEHGRAVLRAAKAATFLTDEDRAVAAEASVRA